MNSVMPILYSFRRCPYAIRARMAIRYSGIRVEIREVILSEKPRSMLAVSAKGTVPVLVLSDGTVIDESNDIMLWALAINDPDQWLMQENKDTLRVINQLINENDCSFKLKLDKYKYHDKHAQQPLEFYRAQGEGFLTKLEQRLAHSHYLMSNRISVADIAIFPFVRQFALVNETWFYQTPYIKLQAWLNALLQSPLFTEIMNKYPPWKEGA